MELRCALLLVTNIMLADVLVFVTLARLGCRYTAKGVVEFERSAVLEDEKRDGGDPARKRRRA